MRVFASLRFGDTGAEREAHALRDALRPLGVELCVYEGTNGSIVENVFKILRTCSYLCVFGTKHYAEETGSKACTYEEIKYWQNNVSTDPSTIIRIRMIPFPKKNGAPCGSSCFDFTKAQQLFTLEDHQLLWLHGTPMPPDLPAKVAEMIGTESDAGVERRSLLLDVSKPNKLRTASSFRRATSKGAGGLETPPARSAPVFMDVSGKAMTLGVRSRVRRALAAFGSDAPCGDEDHVGQIVDRLLMTLAGTAVEVDVPFVVKLSRVEAHLGIA